MTKNEIAKRYILCIIGLFFTALGVAFTKYAGLGVSPISTVANVLNIRFPILTMGQWLNVTNCLLIIAQIIILRNNFRPIQFLQIPLTLLFGWFTDFGLWCLSPLPQDIYPLRLTLVISGVIILGFGISVAVIANAIMNPGEAFVKTLSDVLGKSFGSVKTVFDISCVSASILCSLIFCNFTIVGTREGTLIAAFGTGFVVKWFSKRLTAPLERLLVQKDRITK